MHLMNIPAIAMCLIAQLIHSSATGGSIVPPLTAEWAPLAMITGVRSVRHKSGFLVRVLEADGSSSVAENPVSLFIVATNQGTSDLEERIWRLPNGVSRVRAIAATDCGVEVRAEVEIEASSSATLRQKEILLSACMFDNKGRLQTELRQADERRNSPRAGSTADKGAGERTRE